MDLDWSASFNFRARSPGASARGADSSPSSYFSSETGFLPYKPGF